MTISAPEVPPRPRGVKRVIGFFDTTAKAIAAVTALMVAIVGLWAAARQVFGVGEPAGPVVPSAGAGPAGPQEIAAAVQACERTHGMNRATETVTGGDGLSYAFRSCGWPPDPWADPDGFTEITVQIIVRPGFSEATNASFVDRVTGPCQVFSLSYDFGKQGTSEHVPPFQGRPKDIFHGVNGDPYQGPASDLDFYPGADELNVLHNGSYVPRLVGCVQ